MTGTPTPDTDSEVAMLIAAQGRFGQQPKKGNRMIRLTLATAALALVATAAFAHPPRPALPALAMQPPPPAPNRCRWVPVPGTNALQASHPDCTAALSDGDRGNGANGGATPAPGKPSAPGKGGKK